MTNTHTHTHVSYTIKHAAGHAVNTDNWFTRHEPKTPEVVYIHIL